MVAIIINKETIILQGSKCCTGQVSTVIVMYGCDVFFRAVNLNERTFRLRVSFRRHPPSTHMFYLWRVGLGVFAG